MTWNQIVSAIARRWYVAVLGLAVTAGLCSVVWDRVPEAYESTATVTLVPGTGSIPEGGNPLVYLGGLVQARDVLLRSMGSDEIQQQIVGRRTGLEVTVTADPTSAAPILIITITGPEAEVVREVRDEAVGLLTVEAGEVQSAADAPAQSRFSTLTLTADDEPTVLGGDRRRALLAAAAFGVAATFLGVAAVDGISGSTSGRRRAAKQRRERLKVTSARADDPSGDAAEHPVPDHAHPASTVGADT